MTRISLRRSKKRFLYALTYSKTPDAWNLVSVFGDYRSYYVSFTYKEEGMAHHLQP